MAPVRVRASGGPGLLAICIGYMHEHTFLCMGHAQAEGRVLGCVSVTRKKGDHESRWHQHRFIRTMKLILGEVSRVA